jgi:propanol-preferring alcohol dehydrogenase
VVCRERGHITVERDWPVPSAADLQPGEVLVKLHYSGVCHTDLHAMQGDWPLDNKFPLIGGHEGAGELVAVGKHTQTDLKIGDKVGIKWLANSCMYCEYCRKGYEQNCPRVKLSGFTVDGSFQQYMVSFAHHVSKIPDNLPLDSAAPILCAGVTVYAALKNSGATTGQYVVVPGAGGGLGHLALQYAHVMGLRVVAIDTGSDKQKLCEELGAIAWIDFKEERDIVAAVRRVTDGIGAHAAIVAAASADSYEKALEYLRPRGTLIAVGLPTDTTIKADVFFTVINSKRIIGSYVGNRQDAAEALDLAANANIKCHFSVEPLENLPSVYERMKAGQVVGRIVLKCN